MNPIYFSKIEFVESLGYGIQKSIMLLDLEQGELSYQVLKRKMRNMPAIEGLMTLGSERYSYVYEFGKPARKVKCGKNGFKGELISSEEEVYELVFSYGIKLSGKQLTTLLPYCNALDFEPYRGREMDMKDEGYIGYRDEVSMHFTAITNSYIPKLELPMDYYYDEAHIWPSEKLYRYLVKTYFTDKKLRQYGPVYGRCSLFM